MSQDPLLGQRLANFRIERLLGRGGMAAVYYGWDVKLRRPVAVKVIDIRSRDVAYARRLVHEARIIAKWRHENIVQVYYADQQDGLYYFAMEYVDGPDLGELMSRYSSAGEMIPHADVIRLGWALAAALDFAHARGVIHRDVKPSNVLLAADGRVVLSDFGLALEVAEGTVGEVLGTPHYVAPEQARHSANTVPQSDLYSLGVILYEMLTGSVPFDDPSPMSLALKHMTEPPPLPTSINPALNIPTEAVLLKALSKNPADRFQTGQELMEALESALQTGEDEQAGLVMRTPLALAVGEVMQERMTLPDHPAAAAAPARRPTPARHAVLSRRQWIILGLLGSGVVIVVAALMGLALISALGGGEPPADTVTPLAGVEISPLPAGAVSSPTPPGESIIPTGAAVSAETSLPIATSTQPVDITATPASASTPTILYPDGYRIILLYNDRGFYAYNPGSQHVEVRPFTFEALDNVSGSPTDYRFEGRAWAQYYPVIENGKCANIEILGRSASATRPAECWNFNALRTPESTSHEIFWITREGITLFRVLWNGQEIARCNVAGGYCEVYLP